MAALFLQPAEPFLQLAQPFLQPCEQCLQHQNFRTGRSSVNMAPRTKLHKTKLVYFSILKKSYFIHFCPRSHIYRATDVAVIFGAGDTVHRVGEMVEQVGEMVQQVGETVQPCWRHRFIKLRPQQLRFFNQNKKQKTKLAVMLT